jgi:hypothetical protein
MNTRTSINVRRVRAIIQRVDTLLTVERMIKDSYVSMIAQLEQVSYSACTFRYKIFTCFLQVIRPRPLYIKIK